MREKYFSTFITQQHRVLAGNNSVKDIQTNSYSKKMPEKISQKHTNTHTNKWPTDSILHILKYFSFFVSVFLCEYYLGYAF